MAAGGRSGAETPGSGLDVFRILEGCQRSATPPGSRNNILRRSGGIALLNPRLPSGKPLACSETVEKSNQPVQRTQGYGLLFSGEQVPSAADICR